MSRNFARWGWAQLRKVGVRIDTLDPRAIEAGLRRVFDSMAFATKYNWPMQGPRGEQ